TAAATWIAIKAPRCESSGARSCANATTLPPPSPVIPRAMAGGRIHRRRARRACRRTDTGFQSVPQSGGRPHHTVAASWRNDRDLGGVLQGIIGHDVSSGTNRLITISSRRPAADGSTSLGVRWAISPATIRDADNRVDASCADHLVMVARNGSV